MTGRRIGEKQKAFLICMTGESPTPMFPPIRWTLLRRVRAGSETEARAALETLYCVARQKKLPVHDAQDAVQGFFEIDPLLAKGETPSWTTNRVAPAYRDGHATTAPVGSYHGFRVVLTPVRQRSGP